ncbi:hypothetical protein RvY_15664-2 [Ramazzottius varieornatus]|uniref:EF-hand domain-containing protein n=1 Tax=Ramazzottius varieornatus TaxID=947166 RepID=A0A1D1VVQ7_RAMVA|nr:hypothetical protein RvY_15664-2 [Ramazzottius varieornatus]
MYSGSLNVSGGGSHLKRKKTQKARRTSRVHSDAESVAGLGPSLSVRAYARRLIYHVRRIIFGISESYDPDLDELDLQAPRYVPASLDILTKTTRFSRREIQLIYRSFKQECPTGIVTAEKFRELYSQFFPLGDASYFARQIFQLMDQDMDGSVTFEEYLVVMSMLSRGSLDEKVQWVFNLYDSNGEGQLTAEKLTDVAVSVYEMLGSYTDPPWINETTIKDHVARVFSKMDTNQDGIVTFTEFKEFCITVSIREARLRGAPL